MRRIPIAGPWITDKESEYAAAAAAGAWYDQANTFNERFEDAFAHYVGRAHAVSLPSATSGLHLSLLAMGVGPGDEIIVPDATWIATSAPVSYVGATPVFVDMDPTTWCISPHSLESCITDRTKAVIVVDLYGGMPDMDGVLKVADAHGLLVIEDAAEAIGSEYRGRRAGSFGSASVFSFHGSKTITTGEGGMLVTDDDRLLARVLSLRDHGRPPEDQYFCNEEIGHKYKMSALQAAVGLAQIERVDALVDKKRQIFEWYVRRLGDRQGVVLNAEPPYTKNSYWMVTIVLPFHLGLEKGRLKHRLAERGIASRPFFNPLSSLPAYRGYLTAAAAQERNQVCYQVSPFGLNLPSALCLTEEQVDYVCSCLHDIFEESGR